MRIALLKTSATVPQAPAHQRPAQPAEADMEFVIVLAVVIAAAVFGFLTLLRVRGRCGSVIDQE